MSLIPKRFVGLHAHDGFSTFDGMGLPKEHFDFVRNNTKEELPVPALAITNHGHMNSYAHAYLYAKELGKAGTPFKFLPGVELYVHPDLAEWRKQKDSDEGEDDAEHGSTVENESETKSNKYLNPIRRMHHLVVLPKDGKALEHLFSVVSRGYLEGFYKKPRVDYSWLKPFKGEFIASTACIGGPLSYDIFGEFPTVAFDAKDVEDPSKGLYLGPHLVDDPAVMERILRKVEGTIDRLVDAIGRENLFIELQFNRLTAQHLTNRVLIELARRTGIQLVATADSHYCRPEIWRERAIYQKLGWMNYTDYDPSAIPQSISDLKAELYPKNAAQMWESYRTSGPEAGYTFYDDKLVSEAIERTHDIAFQMIGDVSPDTGVKLPSWSVPKGKTAIQALTEMAHEGMRKKGLDGSMPVWNRKESPETYAARLEYELKTFEEKKFCEYFLTMKAITDVAAERMLIGVARGSAAGSLVNYVLGITQVDPLEYDLIFERFINPMRSEFPDIDSDFADRDLLIKLLKDRFGALNVIPISNYNGFQLKSLVKDVSRFFHREEGDGLSFQDVNNVLTPLDNEVRRKVLKQGDDKNLFELKLEDCIEHSEKFKAFWDEHPEIQAAVGVILHENKSLGKHAGGVIVSERVPERMPVIMSRKEAQTPFVEGMHYKHLNELGWVKFDLLGLETLRIIQRCIELILKRHEGIDKPSFAEVKAWYEKHLHPDVIDLNDPKVYEVYCKGRWGGIFQFTAKGAQGFCMRAQPKNIIDIAAITSIYRPGPLVAEVDKQYVAAKNDPDSVVYEHPLIKEVLGKTFGFLVFQEQMLKLGNVVGKMPLAKCDRLRKVITKRSMSGKEKAATEAEKLGEEFIAGAIENGFTERKAVELWDNMAAFKGYAFNLSHALSYAIDSYMCAWLMTYYEPEWLCAYMETQAGQPEKRANAISELKAFGYEIVGIDLNHATDEWTIMPDKKFMPSFLTVKGIGNAAIEEIEENRRILPDGKYTTIEQLLWTPDGAWRHSKFNKKALENLIKIGGFGSMNIVGIDRPFKTYKHMWHCLVEDNHKLKHKKNGRAELDRRLNETECEACGSLIEEWPKTQLLQWAKELVGSGDMDLIIYPEVRTLFERKGILSIEEFEKPGMYWFIIDENPRNKGKNKLPHIEIRTAKNGKTFGVISVIGPTGQRAKMYCWGLSEKHIKHLPPNEPYRALISASQFGFSTNYGSIDLIDQSKVRNQSRLLAAKAVTQKGEE